MQENLQAKATSAFVWDMAGLFAKQGVAFLVSIFLAHLLLPAEFGLVAMALVFISICQIFSDFGLTSALIQNKDNTSLTYSTVFYFNIAIGVLLFAVFWLLAPFIGEFYDNPEISTLVRWLALNFILNAFSMVQQTILRKGLAFKKIAIRSVFAQVVSGIIAIYLAYDNMGYFALVVQNLLGSLLGTILLWQASDWRPRLEFARSELKKLGGFSVYVFLSYVTGRVVTQLDTLVVGKVFSASTLGLYSRAASLNSLVTTFSSTSISKIAFSLLSQLQEDKERFVRAYFKMLELVAFASFCLSGALILAGSDIISLLFGSNWTGSIVIFQILAMKSFTYPVSLLINSVFWAGGKSKESFWYGNMAKIIALIPLVMAFWWDFNTFLVAVVVASIVNWFLTNWFVSLTFQVSFLRQCKVIAIYMAMFLVIGLPLYLVARSGTISFPFMGSVFGVLFGIIYLGSSAILKTQGYLYAMDYLKPFLKKLRPPGS